MHHNLFWGPLQKIYPTTLKDKSGLIYGQPLFIAEGDIKIFVMEGCVNKMSRTMSKCLLDLVSDQFRHKPGCTVTEAR